MKKLHFQIDITAPKETVWRAMLEQKTYMEWTDVFSPGSYFEGSWDKGARIKFLGPGGDGMFSEIAENRKYEFISIRHLGEIQNGIPDTESPRAKAWTQALENYTFSEKNGITEVKVDVDTPEEFEKIFKNMWPIALKKLKEVSERT